MEFNSTVIKKFQNISKWISLNFLLEFFKNSKEAILTYFSELPSENILSNFIMFSRI